MTIEQEISKQEISTGYLYEINWKDAYEVGEAPLRYCDWGTALTYGGHVFQPAYIVCSDIKERTDGSSNSVTLSVGNLDRAVQQIVETYDLIGCSVKQVQWFNNLTTTRAFFWKIMNVIAKEDVANFTLGTDIDFLKVKVPSRTLHSRFCNWRFKGPDGYCKYSGADIMCEKTWEDCRAKGNTVNFGGAPGIVNTHFYF